MEDMQPEGEAASPQEQAMYDSIAVSARGIIYGSASDMVLEKLKAGEPVEAIGHTAAMVLKSVNGGLEKKGRKAPPEILFEAIDDVITDLVDMATAAKIITPEEEGKVAEGALDVAVKALTTKAPPEQAPQGGIVASAMGAA